MAKNVKSKKISITAFDKIMRNTYTPVETVEWNSVEITIRKSLPLRDVLTFVDTVAKSCFNSETSEYLPEVKVFAIKCCVLEMYANFALPSNVEHKYDLVYNTNAFDTVIEHINMRQLNEIVDAISEKVDNIARANIETINKQMNDIYKAFDGLQNQFTKMFSGISSEDMSGFVQAVSEGKLDEEKLVKAYITQSKEKDGE